MPDPFGGNRSILFALEDGQIVALSTVTPGTKDCSITWKGSVNRFVDCHGDRSRASSSTATSDVDEAGSGKGLLFVDLRKKMAAPNP